MTPSWLEPLLAKLRDAHLAGRMPHGLLIHEAPGAGGAWLARQAAALVLCTDSPAPCGVCVECRRVTAGAHPDLAWIAPIEDSRQIRIEQIRDLSAELGLTAHGAGWKVAVLEPADSLNRFAANALLKTLEEPSARTLLVLVASAPARLPATILSRCQHLRIPAPPRGVAVRWLEATRGAGSWDRVLAVLGDAPFAAATADPARVIEVAGEVEERLEACGRGAIDPVQTAEQWSRDELPLRLRCIANWVTNRLREVAAGPSPLTEMRPATHLPQDRPVLNIRTLFGLLDQVQDLVAAVDAPINRGLALEVLLRRMMAAAGHGDAPAGRGATC